MVRLFIVVLATIGLASPGAANPQLALVPGARANMELLAPEPYQSSRFAWGHELTIALPASYRAQPERRYPVVWVLDGPLMTRLVVGTFDNLVIGNHVPEAIVIGIGSPATDGLAGVGRRVIEFSPPGKDYAPSGSNAAVWRELAPIPPFDHRADDFLALLVDDLRPALAARYRFSGEHVLYGHSAGGMFGAYALFKRPRAFSAMVLGSPYLEGNGGAAFTAERAFAAKHRDLPLRLFIGAGGAETGEDFLAASGIVSGTARLAETLRLRRYAGLDLRARIYDGEDHYTVAPRVLGEGLRYIWRAEAAKLGSSWPELPERAGAVSSPP